MKEIALRLHDWPEDLRKLRTWQVHQHFSDDVPFSLEAVQRAEAIIAEVCKPLDQAALDREIIRVYQHFADGRRITTEQWAILLPDWREDFAKFPGVLLIEACRRWRNAASERFAPTPGALKGMVRKEVSALEDLASNAAKARAFHEGLKDWRYVSVQLASPDHAEELRRQQIAADVTIRDQAKRECERIADRRRQGLPTR